DVSGVMHDATCGDIEYAGNYTIQTTSTFDRCCTIIEANGNIIRDTFFGNWNVEDGGCHYETNRVYCICTSGDLCNTGTYCEQCDFPFSTPPTTTTTVSTTRTSEVTTTSSFEPLSCYSCYDCPEVDASTHVVQDPDITSCLTTILILDIGTTIMIRGETRGNDVIDGDCLQHGESLTCWCKSPLCNDQSMAQILDFQQPKERVVAVAP
ncbi:unnamed protein product, partial [Meganyctiphanes norvegica]